VEHFLIIYSFIVGLIIWYVSHIFDDICDIVLYKRDKSIFLSINKDKFPKTHKYFNLEPEWWKRKYIDGDPSKGRKKFLFIVIPPMFQDAWHGGKWCRKVCHCFMCLSFAFPALTKLFDFTQILYFFGGFCMIFGLISYIAHGKWYGNWLLLPLYRKK
jgi:hypothetical protein